jgi:hypothetical protein
LPASQAAIRDWRVCLMGDAAQYEAEAQPVRPVSATGRPSYLRLCVMRRDGRRHLQRGVLRVAGELRATGTMRHEDAARLDEILRWFNRNLPVPRKLSRVHAVFWFRAEALRSSPDLKLKIAELAQLLILYRQRLMLMKTERPGKAIYADGFQVWAIPYSETFRDAVVIPLPSGQRQGKGPELPGA